MVNQSEAKALTGRDDMAAAAGALAAKGAGTVVITLGAEGCLVLGPDQARHFVCRRHTSRRSIPAVPAMCSAAAWPAGLPRECRSLRRSKLALAAAAIAVTRPGTLSSCPFRV